MHVDHLVHMANRIGDFFVAMPDRTEAMEGLATHIRKFWEPRMRRRLSEHMQAKQGEGLAPIVLDALKAHPEVLN